MDIDFHNELSIRNPMSEHQSRSKHMFQHVKCGVAIFSEVPWSILVSKLSKRNHKLRVIPNEPLIEIGKAKERLDIPYLLRFRLILN